MRYIDIFINGFTGYAGYLWQEITLQSSPWWHNYFLMLLAVSVFFFLVERAKPWREAQPKFRKDFWLDFFYMFFNFFFFSLIAYNAVSDVAVNAFNDFLGLFGIKNLVAPQIKALSFWPRLFLVFIVNDFVQWNTHRLLHRSERLWKFHKVHHSVIEMGFAAHLRYHWMENVVYRSLGYLPLAMLGVGLEDFFMLHFFTLSVGHFNHANFKMDLGFFKYLFNNPQMHIWHHAKELPDDRRYGVNFGITLSLWDYLFNTAYIPYDGRDIPLGFEGVEKFPEDFVAQAKEGFK